MSRMRISTRILPGVWLSQRVTCCGCAAGLFLLGIPLVCAAASILPLADSFVHVVIGMWGR